MEQLFKSAVHLGDAISICAFRGLEEIVPAMTAPAVMSSRHLAWASWQICRCYMDFFVHSSHVTQLPLEWEEARSKLEAFSLFEHVDLELNISTAVDHSLMDLVDKARSLGPYD